MRNKLVDWLPIPALKEMRRSAYIIYNTSKQILAERKADLECEARQIEVDDESDGYWAGRIKGKDIMSILRMSSS